MGGCPVPDELNRAVVLGYPEFCIVESDVTVSLVPYLTHNPAPKREDIPSDFQYQKPIYGPWEQSLCQTFKTGFFYRLMSGYLIAFEICSPFPSCGSILLGYNNDLSVHGWMKAKKLAESDSTVSYLIT